MSATPHIFPAGPKRSVQIAELYRMAAGEAFLNAFAERHADSARNQHSLLQYASNALLIVRIL